MFYSLDFFTGKVHGVLLNRQIKFCRSKSVKKLLAEALWQRCVGAVFQKTDNHGSGVERKVPDEPYGRVQLRVDDPGM